MKLSISVSGDDVAALDRYVAAAGLGSRSAGIQHAIRRLIDHELINAYGEAWDEWNGTAATDWESTASDGIVDATR